MPLLGDIYSYIDALKRKAADTVSNPVNSLNQFIGNIGDQQNQNNALMNQAGFGLLGKPTVSVLAPQQGPSIGYGNQTSVTPQQQALARGLLADQGANSAMAAATVWHGSPHKFDKFDASKIGTGEGAQAYGHGLYLAESPSVAKGYQESLSDADMFVNGQSFNNADPVHRAALQYKQFGNNDAARLETISRYEKSIKDLQGRGQPWATDLANAQAEELKVLRQGTPPELQEVTKGSLYKVDLPDEHIAKMLDWDKPLSQQHPDVQAALGQTPLQPEQTGQDVYNWISKVAGAQNNNQSAAGARFLRDQGIPGIRYLDGGSRGAGQGSSNFVVFPGNEGLLNIMERNGQPVNQLSGLLQP